MQQRRDIVSAEPYPPSVTIGNGQSPAAVPPNSSAIHTYGPTNPLPPPPPTNSTKTTNAKNRLANANAQDGVGGAGPTYYGFYGKQQPPTADYYGKYEVEFAAHHRKASAVTTANQMPFTHPTKNEHFVEPKPDFHHIKGDFHGVNIKADLLHPKGMEFPHGKMGNFHANQPNFYNPMAPVNGQNVDGNHQVPIQYGSQYYPNEYGGGGGAVAPGEMDANAAYYEQKPSHPNYYDNMYHHGGEYNPIGNENPYATAANAPPSNGQMPGGENCDNFMYPQYYDGNNAHPNHQAHAHHPSPQHQQPQQPPPQQQHTGIHTVHGTATATININHGHNPLHQTAAQQSVQAVGGSFTAHGAAVAPCYHNMQHAMNGGLNGNQHIINMENSNSSSDFNFLSNLANDFAPEYYQLS